MQKNDNIYYIYEIPGKKVGCTKNFTSRQRVQKDKGKMIILETHTNIDQASKRELELQREKGYPIDDKDYKTVVQIGKYGRECITKESIKKRKANTDYNNSTAALRKIWNSKKKTVKVTLKKDNTLVGIYKGLNYAARKLNVDEANAATCANPKFKYPLSVKGYVFEYI